MRLSQQRLHDAVAAQRSAADAETRSEIDNIWFEERVDPSRQQAFEDELGEVETWEELRSRHADYCNTFVKVGEGLVPHTFGSDFVVRDLSGIDEKQKVVRVESIARPLAARVDPVAGGARQGRARPHRSLPANLEQLFDA